MKRFLFIASFVLVASVASAQPATPQNHLGWTQVGQTQAVAQGATYNIYVDALPSSVMAGVTCVTSGSDSTCKGNWPAMTPGTHTVTLTQVIQTAESTKSVPLSVTFVVVVTPTGLVVVP